MAESEKKKKAAKKKTVKKPVKKAKPAFKKSAAKKTVSKKKTVKSTVKKSKKPSLKKTGLKKTVKKKAAKKSVKKTRVVKSRNPAITTDPDISSKKLTKKPAAKVDKKADDSVEDHLFESERKAIERGDSPMSLVGHLDELRSRILFILIALIVLIFSGFFLSDQLLHFINKPFLQTGQKLNIFKLTGGFMIRLKAALVAGLMLGLPIIIFQIWRFISPAITKKDRRFSITAMIAAVFLFYGGMAFVFFILLPFAINMLLSFIGKEMLSTIGASDYMSFILLMSLAMGILFELPIVVMILTRIGILTPKFLATKRKYSIIIIWIIAAVITPQDILSQILVAIPLMLLYEISIIISKMVMIRKRKREHLEAEVDE